MVALLRLTDANTLLCLAVCYLQDKLLLSEKCRNFSNNSKPWMTPECNSSHLLNSSKKKKAVEVTESKYSEHSLVTLCVIYGTANICVWISVQTGYKEGFSPITNILPCCWRRMAYTLVECWWVKIKIQKRSMKCTDSGGNGHFSQFVL